MKFKKIFLLICLIICLFSIASVCASEANDMAIASEDTGEIELSSNNVMSEDNLQTSEENPTLTVEETDETLSSKTDSEILTADQFNYTNLREKIGSGGNINLTKGTYTYNDGDGDTIQIITPGVINGNGAVIDMNNSNLQAFKVSAENVTLNNITFMNVDFDNYGGAVYFNATHGSVTNCYFKNNHAPLGSSIFFNGEYGSVINSSFVNNTASNMGGAIFAIGNYFRMINCSFIGNRAVNNGGAVYIGDRRSVVHNCNFTNNSAVNGGAIYIGYGSNVTDCNFTNNNATKLGGAIYVHVLKANIHNCTFSENLAKEEGGAVYTGHGGNLSYSTFIANNANEGGALICGRDSNVENCNFFNNAAASLDYGGGAISFWSTASVRGCNFMNNSAPNFGGAISCWGSVHVNECNFTNNHAETGVAGAIYFDCADNSVFYCSFVNNTANSNGGAIYSDYADNFISDCSFVNNTASSNGGAIYGEFSIVDSTFMGNAADYGGAMYYGSAVNCTFTENKATSVGNAMYYGYRWNCIGQNPDDYFMTEDLELYWVVNNFTTIYGSGETLPIKLRNQNNDFIAFINYDVVIYKTGVVKTYHCLSNDDLSLDLLPGIYTAELTVTYPGLDKPKPKNITLTITDGTTFLDLNRTINGNTNDTITLDKKYTFNSTTDHDFIDGIVVNRQVTINGNGCTINANGKARIFQVNFNDGVLLNDINFINGNTAGNGGAVNFVDRGNVTNCNFTGNNATSRGGAICCNAVCFVTNCNFINNNATLGNGGALWAMAAKVVNCNFTDNFALHHGGACWIYSGIVSGSDFIGNVVVTGSGGALRFVEDCDLTNCNFECNTASNGGALSMFSGNLVNCNFTGNTAVRGSAINLNGFSGTNISNSLFLNNRANASAYDSFDVTVNGTALEIAFIGQNNHLNAIYSKGNIKFTNVTYWGANGIANTGDSPIELSPSNCEAGQNISISGIVNGKIINTSEVTDGNGKIILENASDYYLVVRHESNSYYTEAEKEISNMNVKVTSQETTDMTVNITAKSNIPQDIIRGKLVFILPNGTEINATYGTDGIWWAVHTFDAIGEYNVGASYHGLDNVAVSNATVSVKAKTVLTGKSVTATYNINKDLVITLKDANGNPLTGVNLKVDLNGAKTYTTDNNGQIKVNVAKLVPKTYTAKIAFEGNANYLGSSADVKVTVKKAKPKIIAKKKTFKVKKSKKYTVTLKTNKNKALNKVKVTITIKAKGKKIKITKTTKKGKATFNLKKLTKKGKYAATVKFNGNKYYNKATKKVKITVK